MTETELRNRAVAIAQGWIGAKEGSAQHHAIIDAYNSYTPRPRGYKVTYTDAWCASFVSAVAIKAGLTGIMPVECSCLELLKLYQKSGRWNENDGYVPAPGDLILYDWQDSGAGDNRGNPDHVGMVEKVQGSTITVIEGNNGNAVARRVIAVNAKNIRGYCCPDYASIATKSPEEITIENAVRDIGMDSPAYWLDVLTGKRVASAANVKALMDKYHKAVTQK